MGRSTTMRGWRVALRCLSAAALTAGLIVGTSVSESLTPSASAVSCSGTPSSGTGYDQVAFTTVGSCDWTPPAGVGWVDVVVVGGGGGGGGGFAGSAWGGGGGAGGYVSTGRVGVTPGTAVKVTVGAGGVGGTGGQTFSGRPADAGGGDFSWFGDESRINDGNPPYEGAIEAMGGDPGQWAGQILNTPSSTTTGGDGGQGQAGTNSGGIGGSLTGGAGGGGSGGVAGSNASAKDGGAGGTGTTPVNGLFSGNTTAYGGGGGGGAGKQSSVTGTAGAAGAGGGGIGGVGGGVASTAGTNGVGGGGGGGGGGAAAANATLNGAAGGSGIVIIRYATTPSYLVTYVGNGNTAGTVPSDTTTYASGASATVLSDSGLMKFGDAARGWNTAANATGTSYAAGDSITMTSSVWLYAKWSGGTLPGAPVGPTVTACNAGLSLTWTAPASDGGSPIIGYKVRYFAAGASYADTNSTSTSYSLTGLTNNVLTYVAIAAITANGTGPLSQSSDMSTWPNGRPLASLGACPSNSGGGGGSGGGSSGGGGGGSTPEPTPTPTPTPTSSASASGTPSPAPSAVLDPIPNQVNSNIPASGVPQGSSVYLIDGAPAEVTVAPNAPRAATALEVTGPDFFMKLSGVGDDSDPLGLTPKNALILQSRQTSTRSAATVVRSARLVKCVLREPLAISSGNGFMANSPVKMYILPATYIGTLTADDAGAYQGSLPIPAGVLAGSQTLQANGFAPSGAVRSLSLGIMVKRGRTVLTKSERANVFFDPMSPVISPEGKAKLDVLVKRATRNGVRTVAIGFVQETPTTSNDESLSTQRARNVAAYLRSRGLAGAYVVRGDGIAGPGATARRVNVTVSYQTGC